MNTPNQNAVTGEGNAPCDELARQAIKAGLSIDRLAISDAAAEELKRRFDQVTAQRDELLAAAIAVVKRGQTFNDDLTETVVADDMRKLRAAIAKAEGSDK